VSSVRYRHCVLCEVYPQAEGAVKHRECNITSTADGRTVIRKINSWFTLKIKKRMLKETVEQRVDIVTVCYVTSSGLSINNMDLRQNVQMNLY